GAPAPPGLGTTAQRPQTRARSVNERPVVAARLRLTDLPAVVDRHLDHPGVAVPDRRQGVADQIGTVGLDLVGPQARSALRRESSQQARLATRACTQVEPPLTGSTRIKMVDR